jgi:hypothetical protein
MNMNNELPKHLGGHYNRNHIDEASLTLIHEKYSINSMIDIGCGLGEMKNLCDEKNIDYVGIDGDYTVERKHNKVIIHDYTKGKSPIGNSWKKFDLAWSTEFLEHVFEKYIDNYMIDFSRCKYALVTHAPPNTSGHHHVNLKENKYWINLFSTYGFTIDVEMTKLIRKNSSMERDFIRNNGLFFVNK